MKKLLYIISFLLFVSIKIVYAQEDVKKTDSWIYIANDSGWTITDYLGNEKDIIIPDSFDNIPVTKLEKELFLNYIQLERVVIPNSVTSLGDSVFQGCSELKDVTLSLNLKSLSTAAFKYCTSLESMVFPSNITSIPTEAFMNCTKLKNVAFPVNLSSIARSAFENCQSLENVYVTRKLSVVQNNAFKDTAWLNNQTDEFVFLGRGLLIKYNGNDHHVEIPYGTVFISNAFEDNVTVESVVIPETVRRVGNFAFSGAVNLQEINIPQYVTTIDYGAFQKCRRLKEINLPESLTSIGQLAFNYCENLSSVVVPKNITNIQNLFAGNCPSLVDVILPAGVTQFNKNAFAGSPNVNIQIVAGSPVEQILIDNGIPYTYYNAKRETGDFVYNSDGEGINIVRYIGTLYDVEIPAEINGLPVTAIGTAAFQNNPSVRRVLLPLTVKSIGDWAFSYMDSLQTVVLQSGVESIGANAFTGDPNLAELKLPGGVKKVGLNILDREAATRICAAEGSGGYDTLTADGYWVRPLSECSSDDILLDEWTLKNLTVGMTVDPELLGPNPSAHDLLAARYGSSVEIVRIPDETAEVTLSLLYGTGDNVILMVPRGVTAIDPDILDGRSLTIVGNTGTYAEQFARDNNVKFIVRVISPTGE